ncbi:GH39 family glycosyl hydrolase [Anaerosalibacter bizertensis]|uniref:GH39 family glycosyl hydrolase n=1 Tax=Anaerosalibacter bizertensis TaxID=932217 RepID=UPI003CC89D5A
MFFLYKYEALRPENDLPIREIIHSIDSFEMHWHNLIEILLVLEGTVEVRIGGEDYYLKEDDFILINCNELHSTKRTKDDNILLALQINPDFFKDYCPEINKIKFDCKSFNTSKEEQKKFDFIRRYIGKIVLELNKKTKGYKLRIGSYLYLLGDYLINNFEYDILDNDKEELRDSDIFRLQRIADYVNGNIDKKITLKEIAEKEHISYYYLSHFIKDKIGMSFQEYLNYMRLNRAVIMLKNTNNSITEISNDSGFSNISFFNKIFKENYNCTPTEYRKQIKDMYIEDRIFGMNKKQNRSRSYLDVDRNSVFKKLFSNLKPIDNNIKSKEIEYIDIDVNSRGELLSDYWKRLITFGRASEGLRSSWQEQLKEVQKDIGFEYIRFHGIFSDDMMIVNRDEKGNIIYNWSYVNELFDFFMEIDIKPFVELGFMPTEFKSSDDKIFWWEGNISQPKDINLWTDLVVNFIKYCINRYGLKEVESWYFEVWNEADLENIFWIGDKEDYFKFYKETVLAIKSVSEKLKVGGPSITYQTIQDKPWLEEFLEYNNENNIPLDFVSLHIYPELYRPREDVQEMASKARQGEISWDTIYNWWRNQKIYYDKDHVYNVLELANNKINKIMGYNPEVHITEWNASAFGRNLIHDTCFVSNFIIDNILKCNGKSDSLGYWTFTDIMEEEKVAISEFHGNFGLISKSGLKKPSYFAYYLLSKLGKEIVKKGNEYIVTKDGDDIQILLYNYAYFDEFFLRGDTSLLTNTDRYSIYEDKKSKEVKISILGLKGSYKITSYKLNRENGSSFDEWIKMGAPENMTYEELEYLKGRSQPKITVDCIEADESHKLEAYVPVHGTELILLEKMF